MHEIWQEGLNTMGKIVFQLGGGYCLSYAGWLAVKRIYQRLKNKKREEIIETMSETMSSSKLFVKKEDSNKYPRLIKSDPTDYGYDLKYKLPIGMKLADFQNKKDEIETALESEVKMWSEGRMLKMQVLSGEIKQEYKYTNKIIDTVKSANLGLSVGNTRKGLYVFDVAKKQMNLIVAGYAGSGKSVTLRQMITSIMMSYDPEYVRINLIDLKGGLELGLFRDSPFVDNLSITHEESLNLILDINNEMEYRYNVMSKEGVTNINQIKGHFPYIITFIDEYAEITPSCLTGEEKKIAKEIESKLGKILRMSRAAGIYLVFCTQRPDAQVINGQIRANIQAKICHRVRDDINSRVVLENNKAAKLPPIPGRGIFQLQDDMEFQAHYLSPGKAKSLLSERYKKLNPHEDNDKIIDINKKIKKKGVKF